MEPTELLRRLLDERGVEYEAPHAGFTIVRTDNAVCKFYETLEEPERGVFAVVTTDWLTPEQVIEATLGPLTERAAKDSEKESDGRGECHDVSENPLRYECSECGAVSLEIAPRFCPCCGRRCVG